MSRPHTVKMVHENAYIAYDSWYPGKSQGRNSAAFLWALGSWIKHICPDGTSTKGTWLTLSLQLATLDFNDQ